jgi:4-amino-4-deoxy-L-arabinose transferase-like glycosyltransferase
VAEREWREGSDLRVSRIGLASVLVTAAVLRFWALGHGIPYSVSVDEPEIVERAFNMMRAGSLNPQGFFDYPGLYIYVQFLVSCLRFIAGALSGAWSSLGAATTPSFYLWGRAVTAAIGVLTVLLVFRIGLRWGGRYALLAAALLAVMPLHVRYSHYVLTDTPLTFFVTLTFLLSLVAHERATARAFMWAGVAAGLAAATKYNGGIALVMPLLACWMTPAVRPSRLICALVAAGAAVVAFLVTAPYTILDLPGFLNSFAHLASMYQTGDRFDAAWLTYLKHLRITFGWPALLLSGAGLVLGIVRLVQGPGRVRWALAVIFPLLYFWTISRQQIVYARYLLPIVPVLCVLAATAVISGVSLLRRYEIPRAPRTLLIAALTLAALLPPLIQAVAWDRNAGRKSTFSLAYDWILQTVPAGSTIVIESRELLLPADKYVTRNVPELRHVDYAGYAGEGVDYLVASSQAFGKYLSAPKDYPRQYADYLGLFKQAEEIKRFMPTAEHPGSEVRILKVHR